jgi:hypothetical protein
MEFEAASVSSYCSGGPANVILKQLLAMAVRRHRRRHRRTRSGDDAQPVGGTLSQSVKAAPAAAGNAMHGSHCRGGPASMSLEQLLAMAVRRQRRRHRRTRSGDNAQPVGGTLSQSVKAAPAVADNAMHGSHCSGGPVSVSLQQLLAMAVRRQRRRQQRTRSGEDAQPVVRCPNNGQGRSELKSGVGETGRQASPARFHKSSTRRFTSGDISMTPGHGRVKPSPGHLRVASIPIFEP